MNTTELHVVFGSGPVGLAVMHELAIQGKRVRIVNRSGAVTATAMPAEVEIVRGDATDPTATRKICQGAAVVYNCTNAPYTEWPEKFPPLQAGILAGAASAEAKLVAMDNVYMYGPTHGRPMTEDLPYLATARKGRTRATMAQALLDSHASGMVRVAIGRASDFFGPHVRDSALGERVFLPALDGKPAQVLGNPDLPHTYTYVPDIARGLVILAEHEQALGRAWHLPSAQTLTTREVIQGIFAETGHTPRIQIAPGLLVRAMGLVNPMMRELAEMLYEFEEPFLVDHTQFIKAFGNHATPLQEALQTTVEWYRQEAGRQKEVVAEQAHRT